VETLFRGPEESSRSLADLRLDAHFLSVADKPGTGGLEVKDVPRSAKVLRRRPRRVTCKAKVVVVEDEA
jgi:hypothetical protein